MSEGMAVAVSPQITLPIGRPSYLHTRPTNNVAVRSTSSPIQYSSPGGTRRMLPGQQFGRYQQSSSNNVNGGVEMGTKTASSISLEELAALLTTTSPEDDQHSPILRSSGYYTFVHQDRESFRKSQSFPIFKPSSILSSLHDNDRPRVRRTRSVKFADTQGLPLETVRRLTKADPFETEGGIVPRLCDDLGCVSLTRGQNTPQMPLNEKPTAPKSHTRKFQFVQPGTQPDFYHQVSRKKVSLESVKSQTRAIHGIVRVLNMSFEKEVYIRWSHDKWISHHDSKCSYCVGSNDGHTDRFSFTLPANGDDIEFALCYRTLGQDFWDNNSGHNYVVTVDQ